MTTTTTCFYPAKGKNIIYFNLFYFNLILMNRFIEKSLILNFGNFNLFPCGIKHLVYIYDRCLIILFIKKSQQKTNKRTFIHTQDINKLQNTLTDFSKEI